MYFREIKITGQWVEEKLAGGLLFHPQDVADESPNWMAFRKAQVKVAHGRTLHGTKYSNFYVKHLGHAGLGSAARPDPIRPLWSARPTRPAR